MNAKQLIAAALVFSAASAAFAQQAEVTNVPSTKTRAQITAELQQAQADGSAASYGFLGTENPAAAAGKAGQTQADKVIVRGKTRAEVIAELKQAQADGTAASGIAMAYDVPAATHASKDASARAVANK